VADNGDPTEARVFDLIGQSESLGSELQRIVLEHEELLTSMRAELESSLHRTQDANAERDATNEQLATMTASFERLRAEHDLVHAQLRAIQDDAAQMAEQRDSLVEELQTTIAERDATSRENVELHQAVSATRETAASMQMRVMEAEERLAGAQVELSQLQQSMSARDMELTAVTADYASAQERCVQLEAQLETLQRQLVEAATAEQPALGAPAGEPDTAAGPAGSTERRARGDGGVREIVRHRSDVGNRL
jgi:chromosome segregation ATPase